MLWGIKLEGLLTIVAIVLGPILALLVQRLQDNHREAEKRRRQIFHQLLLTLRAPMAPKHVDAINSVPLEFYANKDIIEAWRLYTVHLYDNQFLKSNSARWGEKKFELLIDLAHKMGNSLGYHHIDKATMSNNIYIPQGYENIETQFQELRTILLQVLKGQRPIPVTAVGPVQVEAPLPKPPGPPPTTTGDSKSLPPPNTPVRGKH
jgi:hypothetical protein